MVPLYFGFPVKCPHKAPMFEHLIPQLVALFWVDPETLKTQTGSSQEIQRDRSRAWESWVHSTSGLSSISWPAKLWAGSPLFLSPWLFCHDELHLCPNPSKSLSLQLLLLGKVAVAGWQELDNIFLGVMTLFILSHLSCGCQGTTDMNKHSHVLYRGVCSGQDGGPEHYIFIIIWPLVPYVLCMMVPKASWVQFRSSILGNETEILQVFKILCCDFMEIFIIFLMLVTRTERLVTQSGLCRVPEDLLSARYHSRNARSTANKEKSTPAFLELFLCRKKRPNQRGGGLT